jgi:signal transduction histidine kinase
MPDLHAQQPRDARLALYVGLGLFAGVSYVLFDVLSEARIQNGTLTGALADVHAVIDHVFPIVVGGLLGVCAHYFRLRAKLTLAEEGAARAEVLRTSLQKVERDQAVWILAAAVLHELNNPLHALGLLLDEMAELDADEARRADFIGRARGQAARALSHLRLLRSMGTASEPEIQRVALDRVATELASGMSSLSAEEGLAIRLECEGSVLANADPAYVRTILENLLANSMHSLRETDGGRITIRLGVERARAVVRISDDGPAISENVRATLFEPLRTTKANGLGLGLPIARALARAMKGELVLEPGDEKAFCLELPLSTRGEASP